MINCLAVDDEPLALDVIENYIQRVPSINLLKKCNSAMEAYEFLQQNTVDLIFLDIQMPELNGIDFVKSLQVKPEIIFTTAFPNYALEGFNLDVVDYLLKPISFDRFLKAVNKASNVINAEENSVQASSVEMESDYIFVKADQKMVKIKYDDIFYVEGMKDYVKIFTSEKMIVTLQTMKNMEENLPSNLFKRVHRSYIISIDKIKSVMGNSVEIKDKYVPIGQSYKDGFFEIIKKHNLIK